MVSKLGYQDSDISITFMNTRKSKMVNTNVSHYGSNKVEGASYKA
jgi:hypothetical protein